MIAANRLTGMRLVDAAAAQASCSYFGNNQYGALVDNNFTGLSLFDNYISGNTTAGLFNSELATFAAPNNYWGASDGPSSDGGSGDAYGGPVNGAPFSMMPAACLTEIVDWDTLPTSYGDAVHLGTDELRLGADGIADDGVTFPALPAAGIYTASITVTNLSGQAAQLVGWIDFDGSGDFDQPDERSSPDLVYGSGDAADGTFATGSIPHGTVNATAALSWIVASPPSTPTSARVRLTTDAAVFSDASPQAAGGFGPGEVENHTVTSNPLSVSLGWFLAKRYGDRVRFRWRTSTEIGVAGFHLLEGDGTEARAMTGALIPSPRIDSLSPTDYQFAAYTGATNFFLDEVRVDGGSQRHGPFTLDVAYGARAEAEVNVVRRLMLYLPLAVHQ